eukprot:9468682-Pyramimonas_sp.AAC.1
MEGRDNIHTQLASPCPRIGRRSSSVRGSQWGDTLGVLAKAPASPPGSLSSSSCFSSCCYADSFCDVFSGSPKSEYLGRPPPDPC